MLVSRLPSTLFRHLRGFRSSDSVFFKRNQSSFTPSQTGITIHDLNNTTFPYIWLRDSCQSPSCIHPATKQKLHRSSDIPLDVRPNGIRLNDQELEVDWADGHKSVYSRSFLETYSGKKALDEFHKDVDQVVWDNESIRRSELFVSYEEIGTPEGLLKGITHLEKYGLLFVRGVPNEKTSNEECELKRLGERLGQIRPTFYGLLWDVVNLRDSKNIAYTNLDLGLHMDLLEFQYPPRYQVLHCLRNRVHGGTSLFVDALGAAETLRKTRPDYFDVLTKTPVAFHYINDGHHVHGEHPTIELAPLTTATSLSSSQRPIAHINYSPPFQAPLPLDTPMEFYPALKEFSKLLNDPNNTYEYTLKEGDAVLFDNRRVLHARTAFYDKEDDGQKLKEGEPNRWLKGCYLEADAIMDRGRVLRTKIESGPV